MLVDRRIGGRDCFTGSIFVPCRPLSLVHICMTGCSNLTPGARSLKFVLISCRAFQEHFVWQSIIVASLSGCSKPLIDLHVSESFLWSEVFNDLQADVNEKIRGMLSCEKAVLLKELEAVNTCAKKLYVLSSSVDDLEDIARHGDDANHEEAMTLEKTVSQEERERWQKSVSDLVDSVKKLANGIDLISEQSRGFFKIVLTGRDTLLCKLRESDVTRG